jgi:hypothetical protein
MTTGATQLPDMPRAPEENCGSAAYYRWVDELNTWVRVCRKMMARGGKFTPPPIPHHDEYGSGSERGYVRYKMALQAWESVWDHSDE